MQTKEKILEAALSLYNEKGVNTITTRHIAASINISAGNLHYHFKHTDDIIQSLYNQLAGEFDEQVSEMESARVTDLSAIVGFAEKSFSIVYKYRFFFLNFVEIGNRIPAIKKAYQQLTARRKKEFTGVFQLLIRNGIFRSDIPENIWSALLTQIFIVGDFWLSNNELTNQFQGKKAAKEYGKIFEAMFYPYLK
ncbi:TetR/AcrR family transcriptional regulator [Chitinophaga silvatica]|uniref:TetR/AcrR family transcriptional regulator n=1 Tax=Chitinophaga silvatica TaxID=2282649 RepID=A0A3E1YDV7_9BACT|nr:TetR/AcrR family transcriptional regulator [Chitinophaga silvatica]RFS24745.1 TetR/AcrR family transcriptional regulator [Chitinophaga silvatica]